MQRDAIKEQGSTVETVSFSIMKNFLILSLFVLGVVCQSPFYPDAANECDTAGDCNGGASTMCLHGKCVGTFHRTFYGFIEPKNATCPEGQVLIGKKCYRKWPSIVSNDEQAWKSPCQEEPCPGNFFTGNSQHRTFAPKKCSTNIDCGHSSQLCVDGKCVVDNGHGGLCSSDAFCPDNFVCIDGKCEESRRRFGGSCLHECLPGEICKRGVCESI